MRRLESHVEWGFKAHDVMRLMREARFCAQRTSPFADLRTMRHALSMGPRLRAAVSYSGIIDGRLRAPSWCGLVVDDWPLMPTRFG